MKNFCKETVERAVRNVIFFDKEGDQTAWERQCFPIGNGFLGASMFGGIRRERIVLNEKSLWAGGPCEKRPDYRGGNRRERYQYTAEVQRLLAENDCDGAVKLLPELTGESDFGAYLLLPFPFSYNNQKLNSNSSCRFQLGL